LRRAGVRYLAVTAPVCGALAWSVRDQRSYLTALSAVALVYAVPGLVVALLASRRVAARDRLVWRLWALGFGQGCATAVVVLLHDVERWAPLRRLAPPSMGLGIAVLVGANTVMVRSRSGQRAATIDAVDLLMATLAVTVPAALLVAEPVVTSPHAWFTVSSALWVVGACHGTFVALVVGARLRRGDRAMAGIGVVLGCAVIADAAGQAVQGVHDFRLPAGPFVALHALAVGCTGVFFLWSRRLPSTGLDRLPVRAQVRRRSTVTVLVLVAVPVIAAEAWWRREEGWVVAAAAGSGLVLLALSSVRHLLSARETARLYRAVEQAADERGELLADVMAHVDADRARVAAHLHRQAVALYTAMASFTYALDRADGGAAPAAVGLAAERMRIDLARQVDGLRQVAIAVEPLPRAGCRAHGLDAPIRAHLENRYGDDPRPHLVVTVDTGLSLDWTTEAVVLRIVQEAVDNVWRHAGAGSVWVAISASARALVVEVVDDGAGFTPGEPGRGIATMRAVAGFIGGDLVVDSAPGTGTCVRATVPLAPPTPPAPDGSSAGGSSAPS
ncbi:MAG TPA: ATP-binding protein, partial [Acidimicrobiales bacterium]